MNNPGERFPLDEPTRPVYHGAMADEKPESIRIKLKGLRTTQEIRSMVHDALCQLEELGVTHLRGVNLYVTPADKEGSPVMPRQHRRKITSLTIEEPYKSAADEKGL